MARPKKLWMIDGEWLTTEQIAGRLGVKKHALENAMWRTKQPMSVAVRMIREGQILSGWKGEKQMVDGRWMTNAQAARRLGISREALWHWRNNNRTADGRMMPLAEAVAERRSGRLRHGGKAAERYWVNGRQLTIAEAAERYNLSENALRQRKSKHKCSLQAAVKACEAAAKKRAEREIMRILGY